MGKQVEKQGCTSRAEWRLQGKSAMRLSSYYQLACDFGSPLMIARENGGSAPIYLCGSHAGQVVLLEEKDEGARPAAPQPAAGKNPPEQPNGSAASSHSRNVQDSLEKQTLGAAGSPAGSLTPNASASVSASEGVENFEAYGTVLHSKPSTATEQMQAEGSDPERSCVSGYGERCGYDPTVHCPKCRKWFCDAHAEDGNWHRCALTISQLPKI